MPGYGVPPAGKREENAATLSLTIHTEFPETLLLFMSKTVDAVI